MEDANKYMQKLKFRGKTSSLYYKDPKLQVLDEKVFMKMVKDIEMTMEHYKEAEEELRQLKVKKSDNKKVPQNRKSEDSDAEKKMKKKKVTFSSDIKEESIQTVINPRTRSQTAVKAKKTYVSKAKKTEKGEKKEKAGIILNITSLNEQPSEQLREFMIFNSDDQVVAEEESVEGQLEGRRRRDRPHISSGEQGTNSSNSYGPPNVTVVSEVTETTISSEPAKIVEEKRKLIWSKVNKNKPTDKDALWVKAQTIKALKGKKKGGVKGNLNLYTGVATSIKEHASLKDDLAEDISKKYLDMLISLYIVLDIFDGKNSKEVMLYFLEDKRMFKLRSEDLQNKH